MYLLIYLSMCLFIYLSIYLSISFISSSINLFTYLYPQSVAYPFALPSSFGGLPPLMDHI